MVEQLKSNIYQKVIDAGYHISDRPNLEEKYPWLIFRLSNLQKTKFLKVRYTSVNFTFDIFSLYNGEKEILSIENELTNIVEKIAEENSEIMGVALKNFKILDDKSQGPVMKHGILVYQFILSTEETLDEE